MNGVSFIVFSDRRSSTGGNTPSAPAHMMMKMAPTRRPSVVSGIWKK